MSSVCEPKQNLQFLKVQRRAFLNMGIDLNVTWGQKLLKSYWKFAILISVVIYLGYSLMYFVAYVNTSISATTGALSVFNEGVLILLKILVFLFKGKDFKKLIRDLNDLAEKANYKEYQKWLSENQRSHMIGKIYFTTCWIGLSLGCIIPIFDMVYENYNTNEFTKKFPIGQFFTFPQENEGFFIYAMNFTSLMVCLYSLLNMTVAIDTLFGWYVHGVSGHFRILRIKVEYTALKLEMDNNRDFVYDVGNIVCYHNKVLKFVDDLNALYAEILLFEVLLSCLQICFMIFTVNNDSDLSTITFNFLVLIAVILQLVIYCFGGEKIKNENSLLCSDFYLQFPWQKMSPKERKLMLFPIIRSQKDSTLKSFVFEVDRNLLVYVLKTAYSFNALLSAVKEI